jgi:hypothetical protein
MSTKERSAKKYLHQEKMFAPRKNVCTKKKCLHQEKMFAPRKMFALLRRDSPDRRRTDCG